MHEGRGNVERTLYVIVHDSRADVHTLDFDGAHKLVIKSDLMGPAGELAVVAITCHTVALTRRLSDWPLGQETLGQSWNDPVLRAGFSRAVFSLAASQPTPASQFT